MGWRIAVASFRAIALLGTLIGLFYLPADMYGLQDALESWGLALSWLSREVALAIFSSLLVIYIIYRDIAPFLRDWIGGKYAAIRILKEGLCFRGAFIKEDRERNIDCPMFKVFVYLRVFNHNRDGRSLKNVRMTVFFLGEKYPCKTITGAAKANISHGEVEDFCIGSFVTKEVYPCYYQITGDTQITEGDIINVNNGHVQFRLPNIDENKFGTTLGFQRNQWHKWSIVSVVSADGQKAQSAEVEIKAVDGDLKIEITAIRPFG